MSLYIVCVQVRKLDPSGFDSSDVTNTYVPVRASDSEQASRAAVIWHGDGDTAKLDDDYLWRLDDNCRQVSFKAKDCKSISDDELFTFLSLTQGVSRGIVICNPGC